MSRSRFITHRGRSILLLDWANMSSMAEIGPEIARAKSLIAAQPPQSLLTLTNVTGSRYDSEVMSAMKEFTAHNKPYVRAAAVVGVTGMLRVVLAAVIAFTKRKLQTCDDIESAKEWLVQNG